ncbi:hypothetical protein [Halocalculus aciditolerans]|nr:hypothetical protein [Halocalculus aciditolerans]
MIDPDDLPDPPMLAREQDVSEYDDVEVNPTDTHRDDLDDFLAEGAWADAIEEWAADADLDEAEYEIARDLGLFQEFDFFWDSFAQRVGYHTPGIPEDWKERGLHPDLDSWSQVSAINAELATLGRIIADELHEYVDWEDDYDAPDDLPDF